MIYQGSKARLIKDILPYIQNCIDSNKVNLYIEPFVGGANVIQHIERASAELVSEYLFTHKDGLYYRWYHEEGYKLWQNR